MGNFIPFLDPSAGIITLEWIDYTNQSHKDNNTKTTQWGSNQIRGLHHTKFMSLGCSSRNLNLNLSSRWIKPNYVRGGGKTLQNITNTETRHTKNLVDCLYYQVPIQIRFFFIIGNKTPERAKCRIVWFPGPQLGVNPSIPRRHGQSLGYPFSLSDQACLGNADNTITAANIALRSDGMGAN